MSMSGFPFELDKERDECFLRLPSPLGNIILTPPRLSDAQSAADSLNHPDVYPFTQAPWPHTSDHATTFIKSVKAATDRSWLAIKERGPSGVPFAECPLRSIREINEDGSQTYIGDLGLGRWAASEVVDDEERIKLRRENSEKEPGDPNIIWSVGYYLSPSYHRRGIMSTALRCLIEKWGVPFMGISRMRTCSRVDNDSSRKTLLKVGFVEIGVVDNALRLAESKGGDLLPLRTYEWKHGPTA